MTYELELEVDFTGCRCWDEDPECILPIEILAPRESSCFPTRNLFLSQSVNRIRFIYCSIQQVLAGGMNTQIQIIEPVDQHALNQVA